MGRYPVSQTVVHPQRARDALALLREARIHPNFIAYLCLKRAAAAYVRDRDLPLDAREFHRTFLSVPDADPEYPYIRPFSDVAPSPANAWLNPNVAGSFARSSFRATFFKVFDTEGEGRQTRYSFKAKHWELARTHLTDNRQISVVDLAVFLYRDYALTSSSVEVTDWVRIFREEFGYPELSDPTADEEFEHLYRVDEALITDAAEWFEAVP